MNLGTMKTALRRIAGVDATDPLVDWINAALTEYVEAFDWPFLEETFTQGTSVGTNLLSLPADFGKVVFIRYDNDATGLTYKPIRELWTSVDFTATAAKPDTYSILAQDRLLLYPTPNATYQVLLLYEKSVPVLVNDVDIPAIPAAHHYTIVEGAAVRALQAESEEDRAQVARGIFEDSLDRHITKFGGIRQSGQFGTVQDAMGYGS